MRVSAGPRRRSGVGAGRELRRRDADGAERGGVLRGHRHPQRERGAAVRGARHAAPRDLQRPDV